MSFPSPVYEAFDDGSVGEPEGARGTLVRARAHKDSVSSIQSSQAVEKVRVLKEVNGDGATLLTRKQRQRLKRKMKGGS